MPIDQREGNAGSDPPERGRRTKRWELFVFLLLIAPSLIGSLIVGPSGIERFALVAAASMARDAGLVSLIVYFLWRNGEPLALIGWRRAGWGREVLVGIVLFVPMTFAAAMLEAALARAGLSNPGRPSALTLPNRGEIPLAIALVAVVAVAEETIFRGYLLLRFGCVSRNRVVALLASSVLFAIGHGYEGAVGIVTVAVIGASLGVVYLWRRSLVAPVTMHFLQDFFGVVVLPLLAHKSPRG